MFSGVTATAVLCRIQYVGDTRTGNGVFADNLYTAGLYQTLLEVT